MHSTENDPNAATRLTLAPRFRYDPDVETAIELLSTGAVGKPQTITVTIGCGPRTVSAWERGREAPESAIAAAATALELVAALTSDSTVVVSSARIDDLTGSVIGTAGSQSHFLVEVIPAADIPETDIAVTVSTTQGRLALRMPGAPDDLMVRATGDTGWSFPPLRSSKPNAAHPHSTTVEAELQAAREALRDPRRAAAAREYSLAISRFTEYLQSVNER
ncbi:MAG: hypothetical protein ACSHW9_00740 [Salinibacterium amurskyense]